jgi:hypothetical protein
VTVKHGGANFGAKGPLVVVVESTTFLAVLYDLCEDGLKVCAGFGYNLWMKGYGVVLIMAESSRKLVSDNNEGDV